MSEIDIPRSLRKIIEGGDCAQRKVFKDIMQSCIYKESPALDLFKHNTQSGTYVKAYIEHTKNSGNPIYQNETSTRWTNSISKEF